MCIDFVNLANSLLNERRFEEMDREKSIEELIIEENAKTELNKQISLITTEFGKTVADILPKMLTPYLEVNNLKDGGLNIWGKKNNVALANDTFIEILTNIKKFCQEDYFKASLFFSGRKSGYAFFDSFRSILLFQQKKFFLPRTIEDFLKLLTSFDARSGWWDDSVIISAGKEIKNGFTKDQYTVLTITNPFVKYPWIEPEFNCFNSLLSGYFLSLYNCCSDYLNVISHTKQINYKRTFCYDSIIQDEPHTSCLFINLHNTDKYFDNDFKSIDSGFFFISEKISQIYPNFRQREATELKPILNFLSKLIDEIQNISEVDLKDRKDDLKAILNHTGSWNDSVKIYKTVQLFHSLKLMYDDFRIKKVKTLLN